MRLAPISIQPLQGLHATVNLDTPVARDHAFECVPGAGDLKRLGPQNNASANNTIERGDQGRIRCHTGNIEGCGIAQLDLLRGCDGTVAAQRQRTAHDGRRARVGVHRRHDQLAGRAVVDDEGGAGLPFAIRDHARQGGSIGTVRIRHHIDTACLSIQRNIVCESDCSCGGRRTEDQRRSSAHEVVCAPGLRHTRVQRHSDGAAT